MMLKNCYRQYEHFSKIRTMMKNNLISLLDVTFPDANRLFSSPRRADGSEKWLDFIETFWHLTVRLWAYSSGIHEEIPEVVQEARLQFQRR